MKVCAFLPAKGSSQRIPNKNIKLLEGKPLFLHTLEKLVDCDFIDQVVLDTESEKVTKMAAHVDCSVLRRDALLADNKTDGNRLFINEVKHFEADIYIQILCTSPFIEKETIRKGVEILKKSDGYDSVILMKKDKLYLWKSQKPCYDINNIPNSSFLSDIIIETMGLYIIKAEAARNTKRRIGEHPFFLFASPIEAVDVNYDSDFELAELIAAGKREKDRKELSNIRNHLTSSILSDIVDDLGIGGIIKGFTLNLPQKKILGKAKTLKIRKLKSGEHQTGIYKALKSYESIVPEDIIVVENELDQFAYFGELNANLAIQSGAGGAIIGGKTRDSKEVADLDFAVFSKGYSPRDVKTRGTLGSINREICIEGVNIAPDDLIFGDNDGIVIIPKKNEKQVLKLAFEVIKKERCILQDIIGGVKVSEITKKHGYF
ncbi:MAG: cytidyltransferase [Candidatus Aminicenantes bacterium]|nr:cytidyltransferase [Candidatus Aminicenantes bacterium]